MNPIPIAAIAALILGSGFSLMVIAAVMHAIRRDRASELAGRGRHLAPAQWQPAWQQARWEFKALAAAVPESTVLMDGESHAITLENYAEYCVTMAGTDEPPTAFAPACE